MVFLLLAVLSSSLISVIMRLSADKVKGSLSMLAVNYVICMSLSAVYAGFDVLPVKAEGFSAALGLGVLGGVLFLAAFVLMQRNTMKNGVVLSSLYMKLGLLVPMVLSVAAFGEMPAAVQIVGFCLAVGAIVLMNAGKGLRGGLQADLLLLLLVGGGADAMAKLYEEFGPVELNGQYLFYVFAVALVLCGVLVAVKKEKPGKNELLYGAMIGVPNFFSSRFLLGALGEIPAVVVYPTFSVATILLVTLTGVMVFKEKLKTKQWIALGIILAALVLLNI